MKRILLRDIALENTEIGELRIFLDDNNCVILLPLLWQIHLANTESIFDWITTARTPSLGKLKRTPRFISTSFTTKPISKNTAENYIGHLYRFILYVNENNKKQGINVHRLEKIDSEFLSGYLNSYLPLQLHSINSLKAHCSALSAFYNFLFSLDLIEPNNIPVTNIYSQTKLLISQKDCSNSRINYISKDDRLLLLESCNSLRDRLILRMGYEVGMRAEENTGLILKSHRSRLKVNIGLLELFQQLDSDSTTNRFRFLLNGKYTKRGRSRYIYFDRSLLKAMKTYYETERHEIASTSRTPSDTLFIRSDNEGKGKPISKSHASTVFRKCKESLPHLHQASSYHDLRHTFATELYHSELCDQYGRETRSESAALLTVSKRLGHKNTSTTTRYIRLRQLMFYIEGINQ
ncbi:tyrosine-type recombinase/integrase [Pleionea sediminis]|uniref:tyrosine-type recombinase/integrase n=1 Tax=Pleionea sediminis TaxID=2569479 RepID=UPI001184E843|nr:site-specific integrase [Pleionea sediminis]